MKLIKRLFKFVLLLVLLVVLAGAVVYVRTGQRPDWYAAQVLDPATQAEAARRAQSKLTAAVDWAAGRQAAELRGEADAPPAGATPAKPDQAVPGATPQPLLSVSFTAEELNAIFQKWTRGTEAERAYADYLADPAIVLHDGRIILVGTVKELDRVVSLHFLPELSPTGEMRLDLESVMTGRLPMPQALFEGYRTRLRNAVAAKLPAQRRGANIAPDGAANTEAVAATFGQLMLNVLDRQPVTPVLFLHANRGKVVPVRVADLRVEGQSVTLAVEMMNAKQRQAFLQRLKGGTVEK